MNARVVTRNETIQEMLIHATRALRATENDFDARLQAEILLAHTLGFSRGQLLARLNDAVAPADAARYAVNLARRVLCEPLAYIIGRTEFFRLDFFVDRRVLIPRHETEILVQLALDHAAHIKSAAPVIADVGTGSGALALTLAQHLPHARIFASDISRDALAVARINAARLQLERVEFVCGDLLDPLEAPFDVLVANLPYIPSARMQTLPPEIRDHEPRVALDGGDDGLRVMHRLLHQMEKRAANGAAAFLEISEEQGAAARELARRELPRTRVKVHQDLEGLDRVVEIRWENIA